MKTRKTTAEKNRPTLDPGNTLIILYVLCVLLLMFMAPVMDANGGVTPLDARQGELLFKNIKKPGPYIPAPHVSQDVKIYVSGLTARTTVTQCFINDTDQWQEAVYVFPLQDESAVDTLHMKIGERLIIGEIKEKNAARKVYEKAKYNGKKASLLVQERPNIFTMEVANIGPGENIAVTIEFSQIVNLNDGIFSLRFPMVVAPRYIPGNKLFNKKENKRFSGTGWSMISDQVKDASRITPPAARDGDKLRNPVELTLELAAGFKVSRVESLYHGISVNDQEKGVKLIQFTGEVRADRDFVLEWQAENLQTIQAALFVQHYKNDDYLLLMVTPPSVVRENTPPPRELIFVLDTSGSMAGSSIVQAREALILAISRLTERDRFNVIEFNSTSSRIFNQAKKGDASHKEKAIKFVNGLRAEGGTEIASAINLALDGKKVHKRIRQVIFLTDGSVGNEDKLFKIIESRLGDSRLFTVGIGSAPNAFFMSQAATVGRGTYTYIGKISEVQDKMTALFNKLEHPAITNMKLLSNGGKQMEYYPNPVPDLYQGDNLLVAAKVGEGMTDLQVSGLARGQNWQTNISTDQYAPRPGISTLWARKKIRNIMGSQSYGIEEKDIQQQVLATALSHHLISKYTSLVAVEQQISRPSSSDLKQSPIKLNLPAGWQPNKIFAGTARTATPAQMQIIVGLFLLLIALYILWKNSRTTP